MRPAVLFLCTGNSARSQMAEGFLRRWAGDRFDVCSAGLIPKAIHPLAVQVMKEVGISIRAHRSKHVREFLGEKVFSHLITFGDQEDRVTFTGFTDCVHWAVEDPAVVTGNEATRLEAFRRVRDRIAVCVQGWLESQKALAPARTRPSVTNP